MDWIGRGERARHAHARGEYAHVVRLEGALARAQQRDALTDDRVHPGRRRVPPADAPHAHVIIKRRDGACTRVAQDRNRAHLRKRLADGGRCAHLAEVKWARLEALPTRRLALLFARSHHRPLAKALQRPALGSRPPATAAAAAARPKASRKSAGKGVDVEAPIGRRRSPIALQPALEG